MDINLHLEFDSKKAMWIVWNITNHSEFMVKFNDRNDAIEFMVRMIAEVKS